MILAFNGCLNALNSDMLLYLAIEANVMKLLHIKYN
jgi:hypothetical protein